MDFAKMRQRIIFLKPQKADENSMSEDVIGWYPYHPIKNITSEDILTLRLNPMSYSILSWYKVKINGEIWFEELEYACSPWIGVAFLGVFSLAIMLAGAIYIQRVDITKNSTEN